MKIIVYDTETSGLDTENDLILELAYGIYHVCEITNSWRLAESQSTLIKWHKEYVLKPEVEKLIGLGRIQCETYGHDADICFDDFMNLAKNCDFVAGQNILSYDNKIFLSNCVKASSLDFNLNFEFDRLKFIDTIYDLPLEEGSVVRALKYFALDHGYVLNGAHQAMNDVFACAHILSCYPISKTIEIASTPLIQVSASIHYSDQKTKDLLYKRGFRWNQKIKVYQKTIREFYLKKLTQDLACEWWQEQIHPKPVAPQTELVFL